MEENSIPNTSSTSNEKSLSGEDEFREKEFIGWKPYTSTDKDKPDILEIIPQATGTFTTEYSECTNVSWKKGDSWVDAILPLKAHNSRNASLINLWTKALKHGKLQVGKAAKILTWLDKSRNGNPIRRCRLIT